MRAHLRRQAPAAVHIWCGSAHAGVAGRARLGLTHTEEVPHNQQHPHTPNHALPVSPPLLPIRAPARTPAHLKSTFRRRLPAPGAPAAAPRACRATG
jgi:hypothetical protein